jgi:hypothetical protein
MKNILITVLMSWLFCSTPAIGAQVLDGAWLQNNIKWVTAPPDVNPNLHCGQAIILFLGTDHTFSLIYATVNRVPKKYEVISEGDGQVVFIGTWQSSGENFIVKYRLVSRTVQVAGEALPGPIKQDRIRKTLSGLMFEQNTFHRSVALDVSVRDVVKVAKKIAEDSVDHESGKTGKE